MLKLKKNIFLKKIYKETGKIIHGKLKLKLSGFLNSFIIVLKTVCANC